MSMATAYHMKKRMAKGGAACSGPECQGCGSAQCYAKGGEVDRNKHAKGVHKPIKAITDDDSGDGEEAMGTSRTGILMRQGRGYPAKEEKERGYYKDAKKDARKVLSESQKMKKGPLSDPKKYADGGDVEDEDENGDGKLYEELAMIHKGVADHHGKEMKKFDEEEKGDIISRILRKKYSEGGKVANEVEDVVDFEPNQFDDLVKDDDLEFSYTGKNSGDELGDEQEDQDRRDIIARIMKSRMKKDRMPRPA